MTCCCTRNTAVLRNKHADHDHQQLEALQRQLLSCSCQLGIDLSQCGIVQAHSKFKLCNCYASLQQQIHHDPDQCRWPWYCCATTRCTR